MIFMKRKVIVTITLLHALSLTAFTQTNKRKTYFPAWTFHQKNSNIHGVAVGLTTGRATIRNTNTNGIRIELIGLGVLLPLAPQSLVAQDDSTYAVLVSEPVSEQINGINLSASGTVCDCITNGFSAGYIAQYNYEVRGISISSFSNMAQRHSGIQMALFVNESYYTKGIQIGLFNYSHKLRGIQIGAWNVNEKRKLPLINWNFKG